MTKSNRKLECPLIRGKSLEDEIKICLHCPFPKCFEELTDRTRDNFIKKAKTRKSKEQIIADKKRSGSLGGIATSNKYGSRYMAIIGQRGGRQWGINFRIRQQQLHEAQKRRNSAGNSGVGNEFQGVVKLHGWSSRDNHTRKVGAVLVGKQLLPRRKEK